jgi:hypothetical protein
MGDIFSGIADMISALATGISNPGSNMFYVALVVLLIIGFIIYTVFKSESFTSESFTSLKRCANESAKPYATCVNNSCHERYNVQEENTCNKISDDQL